MASHPSIRTLAPARVNLLGEHTDYTGGLVLPMAIPFYTSATLTPLTEAGYRLTSDLFPSTLTLPSSRIPPAAAHTWTDYPLGVLQQLQQLGIDPPPFHLHLGGNVPFGAGLSSSASVEVATTLALLQLCGRDLSAAEIARLCQRAENQYVGSPCGIMDQFAVTAAHAGHALLLHTRDLAVEHLPLNRGELASTRIVVCNSMVRHSVATGEYGQRRRELEAGQAVLLARFPHLRDLGDATLDHLRQVESEMSPESFRRCRHILSDNARVLEAREAMFAGDPVALGQLMLAGHASERDDFACSCEEVDFLVETATQLSGCFGARLTGGGFGGCTVNLVREDLAEAFATALKAAYLRRFNIHAETYLCHPVDGAYTALHSPTLSPSPLTTSRA